jgi:hypothetical protein
MITLANASLPDACGEAEAPDTPNIGGDVWIKLK